MKQPQLAVEKYYSIQETALLLGLCGKTVTRRMKAREFGEGVVNLGSEGKGNDYRIPASGINAYLAVHRVFKEPGVAARSEGELRRKVEAAEFQEAAA